MKERADPFGPLSSNLTHFWRIEMDAVALCGGALDDRHSWMCQGALNQLLNYYLPTMKLESKERVVSKVVPKYGEVMTPFEASADLLTS